MHPVLERPILECLARHLVPFEHDALPAHALTYIERRLITSAPIERDAFQAGLAALDAAAHTHEARSFIELEPVRRDALLAALDAGQFAASWPDGRAWFERLLRWVAEAAYAEPGPARERTWAAIGYPERELASEPAALAAAERPTAVLSPAAHPPAAFDAIVIGAGVSGSIVSGVLARAGFRVLLLERGDDARARALQPNHLENHRLSLYGHNTGPALDGHPRVLVGADGQLRILRPHENGYHNNAVGVGGGGLVFGAMAWRFHPSDFAMASRYGVPDESSLADWPLSYDELAPFYERAEHDIGVAGEPGACVGAAHAGAYPMPPCAGHPGRAALAVGARELGWRPHGVPLAINSVPRAGRAACVRCGACVGFACPTDAKNGGHNTLLAAARDTGNITLASESTAVCIDTDASGRVIGVSYRAGPSERAPLEQRRARVVIVACGAIESARLLLDSTSAREPHGLGNTNDQVGRHLQGHVYAGAAALMPHDVEDGRGPGPSVAVTDLCHGNPGIIGGGLLADDFVLLPIIAWRDHLPPGAPRWGAASGRFLAQSYRRLLKVCGPIQEIPSPESRVTLDPSVRDVHGRRVARLSGSVHPESLRAAEFLRQNAERWLHASGAERVWSAPFTQTPFLSAGQHQAGTCRMGHDPATSVVDPSGRVHGHDNLYVIDASVHVTNGGMNPVLTIMALALRNAEALARTHG
jgi:choline dehydrogenase-like flavoprotein